MSVGCANPGPPRPPSLHLPAVATGLKAERVGGETMLTWITPDKTSDGLANNGAIEASICREEPVRGKTGVGADACNAVVRLAVKPGESQGRDVLPAGLTQDPPRLLVYRIELTNPHGRSAGVSAPAFAAAGMAPAEPGAVGVSGSRGGAVIRWTPVISESEARMEVSRSLIADENGTLKAQRPKPEKQKKAIGGVPGRDKTETGAPVTLEVPQSSKADPGGLVDPAVIPHHSYSYTAQRVRVVTVRGSTLAIRSGSSVPVTFTYREVFAPRSPTGLEAVAAAPLTGPVSVDLSWDVSADSGVAGYEVYRSEGGTGPFTRLNADPVPAPAYRDMTARLGHHYRYRVTAVDVGGNESKASAEIEETIKAP